MLLLKSIKEAPLKVTSDSYSPDGMTGCYSPKDHVVAA